MIIEKKQSNGLDQEQCKISINEQVNRVTAWRACQKERETENDKEVRLAKDRDRKTEERKKTK